MKIRSYLVLMATAILVPVTAVAIFAFNTVVDAERRAAFHALQETANVTSAALDHELTTAQAVLRVLSFSSMLRDGDLAGFYRRIQETLPSRAGDSWVVLLDENGQQLINTAVPFGTPLPPPGLSKRAQAVLQGGQPAVSDLILGTVAKKLVLLVDMPVTTDTGRRYVLTQSFATNYFVKAFPDLSDRNKWLIGVFDRSGHTIARSRPPYNLIGTLPKPNLLAAIQSGRVGAFRNVSRDTAELYTVLKRSSISGWTVAVGVPVDEIESAASRAGWLLIAGLLAAVLSGTVIALMFSRNVVNAIQTAAASALELGQGRAPALIRSPIDEFKNLHAAQHEAGKLLTHEKVVRAQVENEKDALQKSEHLALELLEEERLRVLSAERDARRAAEIENTRKDQFLAVLGHELRNPLSAISNAIFVISTPLAKPESVARAQLVVARQTAQLTSIVDDLLELSRITTGKLRLKFSSVDLAETINSSVISLLSAANEKSLVIHSDVRPTQVTADPTRLEQIVTNLLSNAIKFTPRGGRIEVAVTSAEGYGIITVKDSGVGIEPALIPRVFDIFMQGAASIDEAQGGLGIGLSLVRHLAELHGGDVAATSMGAGQGSSFVVRIPLGAAQPTEPGLLAQPAINVVSTGGVLSVLLIDDNDDTRQTLRDVLGTLEFTVLEAANGPDGIRIAERELPATAIIDIGLPGMDGHAIARHLRGNSKTQGMHLIALTGYGQESDRAKSAAAGFDEHFAKPVVIADLVRAIRRRDSNVNAEPE